MKTAICIIAVALCAGCTSTTYKEGTVTFTRRSFLTKQAFTQLEVLVQTNGVRTMSLKGYQNDQIAGAAAITAAAVEAAAKSFKPVP